MNVTKLIIEDFRNKSDLYRDYGIVVNNLLSSLLEKGKYKHQLTHRIKNLESLKEKIKRKKLAGRIYRRLSDIEDVVGMRIVFYTETDRKNFIHDLSRSLHGTLQLQEREKASGYRSTHAIVVFGSDRTRLDEYKRFRGLKCEVQMTLFLNHAWAEVEHDIFYKEGQQIQEINKEKYLSLKKRMEQVMRNYIQKASAGLESIVRNIRKLETEKQKVKI